MSETSDSSEVEMGVGIWIILGLYMVAVLAIGVYSYMRQQARQAGAQTDRVEDHYLAGGELGVTVLCLTVFASLFSGYTVVGVPADAFSEGFRSMRWIAGLLWVALGNVLIAPRLIKLAKARRYISPVDFLNDRFRSEPMRIVAALLMIAPMIGYMTAQFSAMGVTINSLSDGKISSLVGSIALGVVILGYEALGGFYSVSLTDCIQGAILAFGFIGMYFVQKDVFGGLADIVETIQVTDPDITNIPTAEESAEWVIWMIPFVSFPLYPHLMTRIFAAKDAKTYRLSIVVVLVSAFVVMCSSIITGLAGRATFPEEDAAGIFGRTMRHVLGEGDFLYFMGSLVFAAAVAALMSTADSGLMGVSVIVAVDIFKGLRPDASEKSVTSIGAVSSLVTTVVSIFLSSLNVDLSTLVALQNSCIFQLVPAYALGMYNQRAQSAPLHIGMVVGIIVAILVQSEVMSPLVPTVAAGVVGFCANLVVVATGHLVLYQMKGGFPALRDEINVDKPRFRFRGPIPSHLIGFYVTDVSSPSCENSDSASLEPTPRKLAKGNSEPIHNGVLPIAATILALFTAPVFLDGGPDGVTNGMPTWAVLSLFIALASALVQLYSIFYDWDVCGSEVPRMSTKVPEVEKSSASTQCKVDTDDMGSTSNVNPIYEN